MKTRTRPQPKGRMVACVLSFAIAINAAFHAPSVVAEEPEQASAKKLADAVRKIGASKVAVLPIILETTKTVGFIGDDSEAIRRIGTKVSRDISVSLPALLRLEQMENYLAEFSGGDFKVLPSLALRPTFTAGDFPATGDLEPAVIQAKLAEAQQDVDAVILGYLTSAPASEGSGGRGMGDQQRKNETAWRLMDLRDQALAGAATSTGLESLADAVYTGYSAEFFRWEGNRLRALVDHDPKKRSQVPLSPRAPSEMFLPKGSGLNPLLNPNCPYKLAFVINDERRPVRIPAFEPSFPGVHPNGAQTTDPAGTALLPVEPGEGLVINLRNTSRQTARVAIFADGINILGKKRQLPDESCDAWVLRPDKEGNFRGYYTDWTSEGKLEAFELTPWEDSVAGQLGIAPSEPASRTITVVVFTEGPVARNKLLLDPSERRFWVQEHWLPPGADRLKVREYMYQARPNEVFGRAPAWGFGGQAAVTQNLKMVAAKQPGTILAAMTVRYGTQAEIDAYERSVRAKNSNFTDLVTVKTSGQ